ncbi:Zinc finger protein ZAT5 [Sesamum alatum]|uniref:Zinc finger protein ZAT5 n=1 Tax=Sesamum alatum TaxID=300844 RepID=A0AAE1Z2K5_9LAMI|nr:Zinc finger protein ZAT5 [Sesamum alatum]
MMDMEILEDFSASNDQTIVKGKRTKRLRPSSSASSSGGGGEFRGHSLVSSPTTSSGVSTTTEEDEDMANCLILLAQGGFSSQSEEEIKAAEDKFSSRKFTEMATTTAGKVGIYVYECKTCSRAFPSFQALGGHRASHKKPKPTTDIDQKKSPSPPPEDQQYEEEGESSKLINTVPAPPPHSTQSPNYKTFHVDHQINKSKIHECSICGSEFASGQALGGHMRRHRPAPAAMATNTTTTTTSRSANDSSSNDVGEKTRNVLALDLNLPAPPEDDRRDANFHQFSSNQQPLVFSAAAPLVDCHY